MSTDQPIKSQESIKQLLKQDLREGLQGLKELSVGAITLLINAAESIPKRKQKVYLASYEDPNEKGELEEKLSLFQEHIASTESEPVDIAVEIPSKDVRNPSSGIIKSYIYPVLAAISTTALVAGVIRLDPLIQWARTQNECIEQTASIDGMNPADLPSKVMSCNGGHAY